MYFDGATFCGYYIAVSVLKLKPHVERKRVSPRAHSRIIWSGHGYLAAAVLSLLVSMLAPPAAAQENIRKFNVLRLKRSIGPYGLMSLDTTRMLEHLHWHGSFYLSMINDPLNATRDGRTVARLVHNQLVADLTFSMGMWNYLELGVHLPLVFFQNTGGDIGAVGTQLGSLGKTVAGDLRIVPKIRFWRNGRQGLGLAFIPEFSLPTGASNDNAGDLSATFTPRLVLDYKFPLGAVITLNLGFKIRQGVEEGNLVSDEEFIYGLGADIPIMGKHLFFMAELLGAVSLRDASTDSDSGIDPEEVYLEALLGIKYRFRYGLIITAGAGMGVVKGWGTPVFRVFAGVGFVFGYKRLPPRRVLRKPVFKDSDGDGIYDHLDKCPSQPEDHDGYLDSDGCPEPDNDLDGICDFNEEIQANLHLYKSKCKGRDWCPNMKETFNGYLDHDGCPDVKPSAPSPVKKPRTRPDIEIGSELITTRERIVFVTGSSRILYRSHKLLYKIADLLCKNQELKLVRIEGHTDQRGPAHLNRRISRQRARAVMNFLIKAGVSSSRLRYFGYGEDRPLKSCVKLKTKKAKKSCWALNRRVEIRILSRR